MLTHCPKPTEPESRRQTGSGRQRQVPDFELHRNADFRFTGNKDTNFAAVRTWHGIRGYIDIKPEGLILPFRQFKWKGIAPLVSVFIDAGNQRIRPLAGSTINRRRGLY